MTSETEPALRTFLRTLTVGELLAMIKDLRAHPEDRQYLDWALIELGKRPSHN